MNNENIQLINTATELVNKYTDNENHTVAAAVLTNDGKIITSMNFYHFTGGPCAEVAALASMVSEGQKPVKIVAIGHNSRGVLPPCGRCRQTIFDYYPNVQIILTNDGDEKSIKDLLPGVYDWNDQ